MLTPTGVQQALEGLLVALVKVDMEGGHAVGVGHEQRPGVLVTPLMALLFVGRCARTGSATISLEYTDGARGRRKLADNVIGVGPDDDGR